MCARCGVMSRDRETCTSCGYTFPGDTRNPLALLQPWLRLDQMFASRHWEIRRCEVMDAKAQHLPVISEFQLLPEHRLGAAGMLAPSPAEALPPNPP